MLRASVSIMEDLWADTDRDILQCLRDRGAMSPSDLGRRLGISPGESTTLVCLLAAQGKVKIRLVELDEEEQGHHELSWRSARAAVPMSVGER